MTKKILYILWRIFTVIFLIAILTTVIGTLVYQIYYGIHFWPISERESAFYEFVAALWGLSAFFYFSTTSLLLHGIFTGAIKGPDIMALQVGTTVEFHDNKMIIKNHDNGQKETADQL